MKNYPNWACVSCGKKYGKVIPRLATWHFGKCDVCAENNNVTQPKDYGHFPNWFDGKKPKLKNK